jgi:ParB-like nuclease domain.
MALTATIDHLKPGQEYPDGNINARQHYTDAEIEELAVSLLPDHDGQLRPFLVCTHPSTPGDYYVFGGGRRRIAYTRLIERKKLPKSHPIEIKDFGHLPVAEALSKSWADNKAVPMHPADLAATFATLAADRPVEEIAAEHGVTVRAAQQHIALGTRLSPEVIADWREGLLKREAIEVFAITDDHEAQNAALLWAKTQWQWAHNSRHEINLKELRQRLTNKKEPEMKRLLGFVGADEYRAAGGVVTEDFFGQGGIVKDMKLLRKLAKTKMDDLLAELKAEGWSWTEGRMKQTFMHHGHGQAKIKAEPLASEMIRQHEIEQRLAAIDDIDFDAEENDSEYIAQIDAEEEALKAELKRIEAKALRAGATKQQKSRSGVIVSICDDGSLHYDIGLIRKNEPDEAKKGGTRPLAQEPRATTHEADRHICSCAEDAVAELLLEHPEELFALFLASAARGNEWGDPLRAADVGTALGEESTKPFDKLYQQFAKLSPDAMIIEASKYIAGCVKVDRDGAVDPLIMSIVGEDKYQELVLTKFDRKVYFEGASKRFMLGVMAETLGEEVRAAGEHLGEQKIREEVIAAAKKYGWLPPSLRTSKYLEPTPLESAIAAKGAKSKTKAPKPAVAKKRAA